MLFFSNAFVCGQVVVLVLKVTETPLGFKQVGQPTFEVMQSEGMQYLSNRKPLLGNGLTGKGLRKGLPYIQVHVSTYTSYFSSIGHAIFGASYFYLGEGGCLKVHGSIRSTKLK